MNRVAKQQGFTIVELLLAMAFIAVLLMTIALTILQIASIYNRGILNKEVNQASRTIADEFERAMRGSSTFSIDPADKRYVNNQWGGRLCLGQYSYVWNYGKALAAVDSNRNLYSGPAPAGNAVKDAGGTRYEISLVKAPDSGGAYCVANAQGKYPNVSPNGAVELMRSGDHGLVLHAFTLVSADSAQDTLSSQRLYRISYTIGTNDQNALDSTQTACKAPNVTGADPNYCSVQQFTLAVRVVNGVN